MLKVQEFQELTGLQYLMADIVCKQDKAFEKKRWKERLAQFGNLDLNDRKTFRDASNPIGLRAAVINYQKTLKGLPIGYMISLDAASSGLQLLSLMAECPTSFKLCGGDENILDAYAELYLSINSNTGLTRKQVKHAIMTAFYGSEATPKGYFKENIEEFYKTMEKMAPGAWDLNIGLQELWDDIDQTYSWVLPDNFYACVETHDTEVVPFTFLDKKYDLLQKKNRRPKFHKGLGPNLVHSVDGFIVREIARRCNFNPNRIYYLMNLIQRGEEYGTDGPGAEMVTRLWDLYLQSGYLSVRILDYLYQDTMGLVDPMVIAQLIKSMPSERFDLLYNHDCFRCHPNYGNDLRRQYNIILADLCKSKMLDFIASQICKKPIKTRKIGHIPAEVILNANYTLS